MRHKRLPTTTLDRRPRLAPLRTQPDYLITDSADLSNRPPLTEALANPRDALAVTLLAVGGRISLANVVGAYDTTYVDAERWAVGLGAASAAAAVAQLATDYNISPNQRRGIIDDATVTAFAGAYSLAVSWLALPRVARIARLRRAGGAAQTQNTTRPARRWRCSSSPTARSRPC